MIESKRYFNQKFIGMIGILFSTTILVYFNLMDGDEFKYIALITYGIFAGMDSISFSYNGIVMNSEKLEEHDQIQKQIKESTHEK